MPDKVHCTDCMFFDHDDYIDNHCNHSSNVILKGNWRESWKKYRMHPRKLNKLMDCKNFEERGN